jgi:hypothetical protein
MHVINAAAKQRGKKECGENQSEVHTAVRSITGSQKKAVITKCFSK